MFLIGDIIFYPVFGAGCVINIEDKEIYGDINRYYIIRLIINGITVMVPLTYEDEGKVRRSIKSSECQEVLKLLNTENEELPIKWSERYKYYNLSIREGNIFKLASILRDIAGLKKYKGLSRSENNIFDDILNMVAGEIALVLSRKIEDVKLEIKKILDYN